MASICLNALRATGPAESIDQMLDIIKESRYDHLSDIVRRETGDTVTIECSFDSKLHPPEAFEPAKFPSVDYVLSYSMEGNGYCGCYVSSDLAGLWIDIEGTPRLESQADIFGFEEYEPDEGLDRFFKVGDSVLSWLSRDSLESKLKIAALKGDVDETKRLIASGADVNHADENGITAALLLVYRASPPGSPYIESLKTLLKAGAVVGADKITPRNPLFYALDHGNIELLEALAKVSKNIDGTILIDADNKVSPLCMACETGQRDAVKLLISHGANVNFISTDAEQPTRPLAPVLSAVRQWKSDILDTLIGHGLDIKKAVRLIEPIEDEVSDACLPALEMLKLTAKLKPAAAKTSRQHDDVHQGL